MTVFEKNRQREHPSSLCADGFGQFSLKAVKSTAGSGPGLASTCSSAGGSFLTGVTAAAFAALDLAISAGLHDIEEVNTDPDLAVYVAMRGGPGPLPC